MSARRQKKPSRKAQPRRAAISIVIPVYNLEFYIERCLQSVRAQTLKTIEVLIVDDGSTDDSPMLVDEFSEGDTRFKVFHKKNGGHGSACNFGIEHATGEYVMILDGDDYLDRTTCTEMYRKAIDHDADMVMGNLKYHLMGGNKDVFRPIDIRDERLLTRTDRKKLFDNWATPCARIYRREMFDDAQVRLLPGIIFADVNFAPKTFYAARRIYYVNKEYYNYDVTRPTQSMKQTDKKILNVIPSLRDMLQFYKDKGAFSTWQSELVGYTLRHVVSWTDKIRTLSGYSQVDAMAELFAVLDDFFGDSWLGAPLTKVAGERRAKLIRYARKVGYKPLAWSWKMRHSVWQLDEHLEGFINFPFRKYQDLKMRVKTNIVERLTY